MIHHGLTRHLNIIEIGKDDVCHAYRQSGEKQLLGKQPLRHQPPLIRRLVSEHKKETDRRKAKQHKLERQCIANENDAHQEQGHHIADDGADGKISRKVVKHEFYVLAFLPFSTP